MFVCMCVCVFGVSQSIPTKPTIFPSPESWALGDKEINLGRIQHPISQGLLRACPGFNEVTVGQ